MKAKCTCSNNNGKYDFEVGEVVELKPYFPNQRTDYYYIKKNGLDVLVNLNNPLFKKCFTVLE